MIHLSIPRFSFLLAGLALAVLGVAGFLTYSAGQEPVAALLPAHHVNCGEPVTMRAEDYNWLGGTRPGDDIALARVDFCDPVRLIRDDGRYEIWFWMEVEVVGQVFPYASWGYPWVNVETPFPADFREPHNPWWQPRSSIRALPAETTYHGGDGVSCPTAEANARGLNMFFFREEGFQIPIGLTHSGWACLYFDGGNSVPDAFTVTLQPDRARITRWVDRFFVTQDDGQYDQPPIPAISEQALCAYARWFHPDTIREGGACDQSIPPDETEEPPT